MSTIHDGKIILLITGANRGLGFETIKILLESKSQAYHILLCSRQKTAGNQAIHELVQTYPDTPSTLESVVLDVESEDSIAAMMADVKSKVDRVDVLINNAGMLIGTTF